MRRYYIILILLGSAMSNYWMLILCRLLFNRTWTIYIIGVRSRAQINGALRFSIQLTLRILGDCSWSSWNLQHIFQRSSEESLDANGCCWISVKWPRMRDKNDMIYSDYAGLPPFSKLDKCHLYPSLKRVTKHEGQATYTLLFKLLWWYHAKSEILPKIPCSWKAMPRSGCHTAVATWQKLSLPDMGRGFWVSGLYILTNRMDGWADNVGIEGPFQRACNVPRHTRVSLA